MSGSKKDDADDSDRQLVRGQRHGVLGVVDDGRRGASDGVLRRDVLVGRPLTESRGVKQSGRLMLNSAMMPVGRMAKGEVRQGGDGRSEAIKGGGGAMDDEAAVSPSGAGAARPARGGPGDERQGGELAWEAPT